MKCRSVLLPMLVIAFGCAAQEEPGEPAGKAPEAAAYVLAPDDGEVLVPCRPGATSEGRWIIKADPENTGSTRMAMGTQLLPGGEQIPVHRHEEQDEILFIHEGHATGVIGDSSVAVTPGTTIFVPRGVWHGVRNPEEDPVKIVWVVAPPGLEGYFRAIGLPPDAECVPLPADELAEIRRRHGITQKIE